MHKIMLMFAHQRSVFNLCAIISSHFPIELPDKGFVCVLHAMLVILPHYLFPVLFRVSQQQTE